MYSRCINVHGREGSNNPCDLHMEHLNRTIKYALQHLEANKTEQAIMTASKCSHLINSLLQQFDTQTGLKDESGSHTRASEKSDIERMLVVLCNNKVFSEQGTRSHIHFQNFRSNHSAKSLDMSKFQQWMTEQFQPQQLHSTLHSLLLSHVTNVPSHFASAHIIIIYTSDSVLVLECLRKKLRTHDCHCWC